MTAIITFHENRGITTNRQRKRSQKKRKIGWTHAKTSNTKLARMSNIGERAKKSTGG